MVSTFQMTSCGKNQLEKIMKQKNAELSIEQVVENAEPFRPIDVSKRTVNKQRKGENV